VIKRCSSLNGLKSFQIRWKVRETLQVR
jgi:hypothetical protein